MFLLEKGMPGFKMAKTLSKLVTEAVHNRLICSCGFTNTTFSGKKRTGHKFADFQKCSHPARKFAGRRRQRFYLFDARTAEGAAYYRSWEHCGSSKVARSDHKLCKRSQGLWWNLGRVANGPAHLGISGCQSSILHVLC